MRLCSVTSVSFGSSPTKSSITQHGLPAAYLVDVQTYDALQKASACLRVSPEVRRRLRTVAS